MLVTTEIGHVKNLAISLGCGSESCSCLELALCVILVLGRREGIPSHGKPMKTNYFLLAFQRERAAPVILFRAFILYGGGGGGGGGVSF